MNALPATAESGSVIEHADALQWLKEQPPGEATAIIMDPPYAVGTPVRGREDGAAGSVFAPFGFLHGPCPPAPRPCGPAAS